MLGTTAHIHILPTPIIHNGKIDLAARSSCVDRLWDSATVVLREAEKTYGTGGCYEILEPNTGPDPCNARLDSAQIQCLESYFEGETDMDACAVGFESVHVGSETLEWEWAFPAEGEGHGDLTGPMWEPIDDEDEDEDDESEVAGPSSTNAPTNAIQEDPDNNSAGRTHYAGLGTLLQTAILGLCIKLLLEW
ncbi:hypothetical protein BJY00DRAFT_308580 [Aspergillus carlsbadensis]|nr:hypothetical protein BJY00DRAFT_308580 [Aspergillus carlsbadensis]